MNSVDNRLERFGILTLAAQEGAHAVAIGKHPLDEQMGHKGGGYLARQRQDLGLREQCEGPVEPHGICDDGRMRGSPGLSRGGPEEVEHLPPNSLRRLTGCENLELQPLRREM